MGEVQTPTEREFVESLIATGVLSPAARGMDVQQVINQHNETNALSPGDTGFLVHPDLMATTIETATGSIGGWALRSNPSATCDTPDIHRLRGTDRISRRLGNLLGLGEAPR